MSPMTTPSASARPYSVNVRVIHQGDFDSSIRLHNYVDRGLSPSEIDSLASSSDIRKLTLTSLASSPLTLIVLIALVAWGTVQWMAGSVAGVAVWAAVVVPFVSVLAVAYRTKNTTVRRLELLKDELIEAGRLANPHERRSDLRRIQTALTVLQTGHGSAFDGLARKAVIAVLDQELNAPSQKTLAIAESKATDPDSVTIRARVLAQKAQRDADMAKAESLIFELEQFAAATKNPAPVTAG